jgi:phosphoenolpyruvate carboxykinase (GTP)
MMPEDGDLDLAGLDIPAENIKELMDVDLNAWRAELRDIERHFAMFGNRLPGRLGKQLEELRTRLG